jgi:hypothetical protein
MQQVEAQSSPEALTWVRRTVPGRDLFPPSPGLLQSIESVPAPYLASFYKMID